MYNNNNTKQNKYNETIIIIITKKIIIIIKIDKRLYFLKQQISEASCQSKFQRKK